VVLLITATSGLAYSHWSESLYINTTVNTGTWNCSVIGSYKVLVPTGYDDINAEPENYLSADNRTLVITCDNVFNCWYTWVGLKITNVGTIPELVKTPIIEFDPDVGGSFEVENYFYGPYRYGYEVPEGLWGQAKVDNLPFEPYGTSPIVADPNEHVIVWIKLHSTDDLGAVQISITIVDEQAV